MVICFMPHGDFLLFDFLTELAVHLQPCSRLG